MTGPNFVIQVRNLTKSYGKSQVLKGINLQVERGTMVALLGPNGAGKTTIVRILSTLLGFDGGTVLVDGHDVTTEADKVRAVIGLTGQAAAVDELLTGRENLVMMGRLYRLTAASARVRAQELLEEFDLVEAAGRPAKTYSGGMRRRLDLAVSLIATPPVLFPGRAHHRPRSPLAPGHVGDHQEPARGRHHHPADHPVPRRGRPAG